jgi:ribonucleoside-triphosphate reductase
VNEHGNIEVRQTKYLCVGDSLVLSENKGYATLVRMDLEHKLYVNSYDVETESGYFDIDNRLYSHNCRSFLTPDYIHYKTYGRFNQGVVTINLIDVALTARQNLDMLDLENGFDSKLEKEFWKVFDERLEICHRALQIRNQRLQGTPSDVSPIHWQHGALARLEKGETIDKLLYNNYSTLSLGYAGLYECVYALTGKSHTDEESKPFALSIMQHMNDKCAEWRAEESISYSLYGTPIESTTYKFAKCLKERFGIIEGVTDHDYVTNSYHVSVRENIDAFTKLKFESEFQELSPGGAISYVETPNMDRNLEALLTSMEYIYDNILYAEFNTKSDYCMECGFDGEIVIKEKDDGTLYWECPNCGNHDQRKMSVARRTCGYIGTAFWNQGRTEEIRDRVMHYSVDTLNREDKENTDTKEGSVDEC